MQCLSSWREFVAAVEITQVASAEKESNSYAPPALQDH
jgi:hypothetical protein